MQLISIRQLSKEQNISVSQVRNLIRWGLPHYRVNKKILIDKGEFSEWFRNQYRIENNDQNKDIKEKIDIILKQFKAR